MSILEYLKENMSDEEIKQMSIKLMKDLQSKYEIDDFKSLCLDIAKEVYLFFKKHKIDVSIIQGKFTIDDPDPLVYDEWDVDDFESEEEMENEIYNPIHFWNEVDGKVLDLTIRQFQDEVDDELPDFYYGSYENSRYTKVKKIK